jgi:hypothetical protein
MITTDFRNVIVFFQDYIKPEGIHQAVIDTLNGDRLKEDEPVTIEFVSGYIFRGGHQVYNILLNCHPCVMNDPSDRRRVEISNWAHYTNRQDKKD